MDSAEMNEKIEKHFNWDDIDAGNYQLDHSQNFFAVKRHVKQEGAKEADDFAGTTSKIASARRSEGGESCDENKENIVFKSEPNLTVISPQKAASPRGLETGDLRTPEPDPVKPTAKVPPNIAYDWSTKREPKKRGVHGANAHSSQSAPSVPRAYEMKDLYNRKRQDLLSKQLKEERKMRQFHSRPAPNFKEIFERLEKKPTHHWLTVPETPQVLKKSRETDERRKKMVEEWKRKQAPLKFEHRSPDTLRKAPFVPKKPGTVVQPCPFNLRADQRVQERRVFNAAHQQALEEKERHEEEERKKREEEQIRELKKMATFKARPNPFK